MVHVFLATAETVARSGPLYNATIVVRDETSRCPCRFGQITLPRGRHPSMCRQAIRKTVWAIALCLALTFTATFLAAAQDTSSSAQSSTTTEKPKKSKKAKSADQSSSASASTTSDTTSTKKSKKSKTASS